MEREGTPYRGRASVGELAPADAAEVPAARCVAFVRTLLRGHYARIGGRCACGLPLAACEVRALARLHGIPVDPALGTGLRAVPPGVHTGAPSSARHRRPATRPPISPAAVEPHRPPPGNPTRTARPGPASP